MRKNFHSSEKLIVSDSDIDIAFSSMDESVITKIKNFVNEDWIVKTIAECGIKIFQSHYRQK